MSPISTSGGQPVISLVVLAWNNIDLTRRCVDSLRQHTDVSSELIIVDNGSTDGTVEYAASAADIPVLNSTNLGFAAGMNSGLGKASAQYVAFINNDTAFPQGWARPILEDFDTLPNVGMVLPAVTAAGNPVTVRETPGTEQVVLTPFGEFPSGVVCVLNTDVMQALGGWNEQFQTASAEDLDLCFTVWAHGLDVVLDERVLIEHESQASVRKLPDRKNLYRENLAQFLDRWESGPLPQPLLESTDPELLRLKQEQAQTAIAWIRRMLAARDDARALQSELHSVLKRNQERGRWFRSRS